MRWAISLRSTRCSTRASPFWARGLDVAAAVHRSRGRAHRTRVAPVAGSTPQKRQGPSASGPTDARPPRSRVAHRFPRPAGHQQPLGARAQDIRHAAVPRPAPAGAVAGKARGDRAGGCEGGHQRGARLPPAPSPQLVSILAAGALVLQPTARRSAAGFLNIPAVPPRSLTHFPPWSR